MTGERRTDGPRTKVVIRRVDPWSILKFSLLFYFCLMLVLLFALLILCGRLRWPVTG